MNNISKRQQFFKEVLAVQNGRNSSSSHVNKIANQINPEHAKHFANALSEKVDLRDKKAIVAMLKDIVEPMYLNEEGEEQGTMDATASTFHKKEEWAKYIKMYIGQPLSPKEIESLGNFKEKKPTKIARTEIWYNTTDSFGSSHTTVIKKMKDSGQFSFVAFTKQERVEPDKEESGAEDGVDGGMGSIPDLGGGMPSMGGTPNAPIGELTEPPSTSNEPTTTSTGTVPSPEEKQDQEKVKDDIVVTKSILFKDEIKGAAILVEFLKKLNL